MSHSRSALVVAVVATFGFLLPIAAFAQNDEHAAPPDVVHTGPDYNDGKPLPMGNRIESSARLRESAAQRVGQRKYWLAVDDVEGVIYAKRFTLRGIGDHIEVWVASDSDEISRGLQFPEGDCRNDHRTRITDRQVKYLIREFDRNIYPKESRVFGRPPRRNGEDARFPRRAGLPRDYYKGQGDNIVTLVDNIRDANFYNQSQGYISGFFFSFFNEMFDRNVMTIDGFDWLHRTGASPPDEPTGDPCTTASAQPLLLEGTFAHEYEHLLEYYEDHDERLWVDEGLASWAQSLTGYSDPSIPFPEFGFDIHVWSFLGYLLTPTETFGGPENSLNLWGDQGANELGADYGATYTFMELLAGRFGKDFMGRLHRVNAPGFAGITRALNGETARPSPRDLIRDWIAAVALDGILDDGAILTGGDPAAYRVRGLDATVNWDMVEAFDTPGAPPNGADYVRLRGSDGSYLSAGEIQSISFDGAETTATDGVPVSGFTVQLIAYDDAHTGAWIKTLPLGSGFTGSLSGADVAAALGTTAETVAALVMYDEPTENIADQARYTLTVNGVVQPGG